MKKYLAELVGTFVLVLFGCGAAAITGGVTGHLGILGIAMAFGLSIVAMAYCIGGISGCHINPAVSLGVLLSKKMTLRDFAGYVIAQCLGAIGGAAVLKWIILSSAKLDIAVAGLGQNGFEAASFVGLSCPGAFVVEIILTFVFVLTILGVTSSDKTSAQAGLVIGLTLAFVHILGISLTGTSVNPARSLGPALLLGGVALEQVWVFLTAPFAGAALAAVVWAGLSGKCCKAS